MQEFNKVSTTSNFIKQLLNTTYLPVVRTVQAGDYIVGGRLYIYRCEIISCTSSGYLLPYSDATLSPKAEYTVIGEYAFGEKNDKLCTNYQSSSEGYDSVTHEKLGDYLRALRDMYGLNLMPLYNCFSNNPLGQYHIFEDRIVKTSYDYHTKIYKVPIRFNTDYTICIENLGITTFAPAFIRNESLIKLNKTAIGDGIDATNRYISLYTNDVISSYAGLRFFDPIKIRFDNIPETKTITYFENTGEDTFELIDKFSQEFYTPVTILSTEDFTRAITSTPSLYYRTTNGQFERIGEDQGPYFGLNGMYKPGAYYTCNINPKEAGWYDGDIPATDTCIEPDIDYYNKVSHKTEKTYTYDIEDVHCQMYDSIENTLYLLIQVPSSFESNIVVLEGDYTNVQSFKYFNEADLKDYPENYLDKLFIHDIRLMRMNVPQVIPFSDSLVQFLLWNAICGLDTINFDMDRLLISLRNLYVEVDEKYYANYWYYRYRELISNYAKLNSYTYIDDNLGYVTSEIEALLNRR